IGYCCCRRGSPFIEIHFAHSGRQFVHVVDRWTLIGIVRLEAQSSYALLRYRHQITFDATDARIIVLPYLALVLERDDVHKSGYQNFAALIPP
uniref:Uncharacterized protein n=1 Tax=Anopheles christyi TaxID=43041 RepID=A0A182KHY7_9DIPT